jgi:hypothetical protein
MSVGQPKRLDLKMMVTITRRAVYVKGGSMNPLQILGPSVQDVCNGTMTPADQETLRSAIIVLTEGYETKNCLAVLSFILSFYTAFAL